MEKSLPYCFQLEVILTLHPRHNVADWVSLQWAGVFCEMQSAQHIKWHTPALALPRDHRLPVVSCSPVEGRGTISHHSDTAAVLLSLLESLRLVEANNSLISFPKLWHRVPRTFALWTASWLLLQTKSLLFKSHQLYMYLSFLYLLGDQ